MAIDPKYEKLVLRQKRNPLNSQSIVTCTARDLEDMEKVIGSSGVATLKGYEVRQGEIKYTGRVIFSCLYITQDGEYKKVECGADFTHKCQSDEILSGDEAKINFTLENIEINDSMIGKTIIQNINDTTEFPRMVPIQPQALINILIEHKKFRLSKNNPQRSDQQRPIINDSMIRSMNNSLVRSIETQINNSINKLMNDSIKTSLNDSIKMFIEQTDSRFNQLNNQFNSKNEIIRSSCFLIFILMMLYVLYIINEFVQPTFF